MADTPARLAGAEFEIGKWIWVDHKPAILSLTESLREGSNPSLIALYLSGGTVYAFDLKSNGLKARMGSNTILGTKINSYEYRQQSHRKMRNMW